MSRPRTRKYPDDRKAEILTAALNEARRIGYRQITREMVAERVGVSPGLVSRYFGTMVLLRRAIMSAAVARGDLRVLGQGLAAGDPKAKRAPEALRRAALDAML